MHPVSNLGTVSGLFLMEVAGLLIMMFSYFCHNKTGSMLASRIGVNMKSFFLWGTMINIVMMAYLPMLMATFISCVGMQWGEEVDTPMLLSNLWTIFMMCSWIAGPVFLFIIFAYRREQIGMRSPMLKQRPENEKRDVAKVSWKQSWAKIDKLLKDGKKPLGLCKSAANLASDEVAKPTSKSKVGVAVEEDEAKNQQFEGGNRENDENESLMDNDELENDLEAYSNGESGKGATTKKNAWALFGKQLPAWLVPRKRNERKGEPIKRAQEEMYLPTNKGMELGDRTKED